MDVVDASIRIVTAGRILVSVERFRIPEGKIMVLFGESGIGKSLIAKTIFGLLDPSALHVTVDGAPYAAYLASKRAQKIRRNGFFVFQEPSSHLNPLMPIREQLREGDLAERKSEAEIFEELWGDEWREKVRTLFPVYPKPYRPSGGEKQRILLAMAMKKIQLGVAVPQGEAGLFVFDEPTGSLDDPLRDRFLAFLFKKFRSRPFTGLLITHDYSIITPSLASVSAVRDNLTFRELVLQNRSVFLRELSPAVYSDWVSSQRAKQKAVLLESPSVLTVESGIRVFGQTLRIFSDSDGRDECPLLVRKGRMTYLKAPSGTGKTTLIKAVMGLIPSRNLRASAGGVPLDENRGESFWRKEIHGRKMTMVFQHADEALNLQSKVEELFGGLPLPQRLKNGGLRNSLRLLFEEEEIDELLPRKMHTLSGGQKQKLNVLRCLVLDTSVLILDEPLNGLDFESAKRVIDLLNIQKREGKGLLVISHNEEIFDTQAEEVYYLRNSD